MVGRIERGSAFFMPDMGEQLSALLEDKEFLELSDHFKGFNIFEAVNVVRRELPHSDLLRFLLSPNENHGLGPEPLRLTLQAILEGMAKEQCPVDLLEVMVSDLDGAKVYRELDHSDILIVIKELRLVVLIENKVDSDAGDGQLGRYKRGTLAQYPRGDWKHLFVFLTPTGAPPDDPDYVSFEYTRVAEIIDRLNQGGAPQDVAVLLRHYATMLRRHIVNDDLLRTLAQKVYERHGQAIKFINRSHPEPDSLLEAVGPMITEPILELDGGIASRGSIYFLPSRWESGGWLYGCDRRTWTRTGRSLLFQVQWDKRAFDRTVLRLVLGPAKNDEWRKHIHKGAGERPDVFRKWQRKLTPTFTTLYSRDLLSTVDGRRMEEYEEKVEKITAELTAFLRDDLPRLTEVIIEIANAPDAPKP